MKAGFAERDISPEVGQQCPGNYVKQRHEGFHDPCKVRAAVFGGSPSTVALVGVDATFIPSQLVQEARREIQAQCGLPPEAVLVSASHTHAGGPTGMILPGQFDHASPLVRRLAYEESSCADPAYLDRVRRAVTEAVRAAHQNCIETQCGVGSGREPEVAFNRRFRMRNGLTFTHPRPGNPDVVEPAGPTDPEVGVLGAWDATGRLTGCVVNFACHGTTGPKGISADWVYYLEQTIRGVLGAEAVVVFLNGACADVTQVDNLSPHAARFGERWARFVGGRVGAEAVKVLLTAEPGNLEPVAARQKVLRIPRRKPTPERVRRCLETVEKGYRESDDPTQWIFAKEIVLLDALLARAPVADVEIQAVQIGPAVFLANPAELFCQYGLDLKAGSPFPFTFPVELANGSAGYVPTEEAFGPQGGGYETRMTSYSNLDIGAGRKIVEGLRDLAAAFTPGLPPTPPPAPPFRGPWTYGNVPPELE